MENNYELSHILETERLLLRPLRLTDAPRIQRLFPHWEILKFMGIAIPWPYPEDGARAHLEATLPKMEAEQQYDWAITLKSEAQDQLIGIISLHPNDERDNRGFWLAKEHHNKGLMTEAVAAVTDFAFYELEMPILRLNNAEPNIASHRLKEKAGAKIVSITPDVPYVGGRFNEVNWILTREDWDMHRDQFTRPIL